MKIVNKSLQKNRRRLLCCLCFLLFNFSVFPAFTVQQAWVAKYNNGTNSTSQAVAIALDPAGNVIVAGNSTGETTASDYVTIKYSALGAEIWVRRYASPGAFNDEVRGMKVDSEGNVILTGTSDTVMYNSSGSLLWSAPYAGRALVLNNSNVYVTGFSATSLATVALSKANGSNVWLRTFTVLGGPDKSEAITLDSQSNVFIAGTTTWYNFRGIRYIYLYTIGYTSSGSDLWQNRFPGSYSIINVKSLATDNSGNVYIMANIFYPGGYTYHTLKCNNQGTMQWTYYLENLNYDAGKSLVLDTNGFPYLTGTSIVDQPPAQFGTIKLDKTTGTNIWHRQYAGPGQHEANALALDSSGNVYVTGKSAYPLTSTPNDFATVKYDPEGNLKWSKRFNGPANLHDEATAIAVSPSGDVYVTGYSTTAPGLLELTTIKYIQVAPIEKKTNGNILLTFCGAPGSNYVIEATSTLSNWTDIGTTTADANGLYSFEDTNAPSFQQRFYRTKQE